MLHVLCNRTESAKCHSLDADNITEGGLIMKVRELIEKLQALEDKELDVTHYSAYAYIEIESVEEEHIWFGGVERKCVNLY